MKPNAQPREPTGGGTHWEKREEISKDHVGSFKRGRRKKNLLLPFMRRIGEKAIRRTQCRNQSAFFSLKKARQERRKWGCGGLRIGRGRPRNQGVGGTTTGKRHPPYLG